MPGPVSATQTSTMFAVRPARDQQFPARRLFHGLDRIADQVQQHLLDLHLVDQDEIVRRIDLKSYSHAMFLRAHQRERARLFDQFLDAFDAPLAFAARDEIAQSADDLAGAQRLLGGLLHCVADHDSTLRPSGSSSSRRDPFI